MYTEGKLTHTIFRLKFRYENIKILYLCIFQCIASFAIRFSSLYFRKWSLTAHAKTNIYINIYNYIYRHNLFCKFHIYMVLCFLSCCYLFDNGSISNKYLEFMHQMYFQLNKLRSVSVMVIYLIIDYYYISLTSVDT